jgi:hypothetical protein
MSKFEDHLWEAFVHEHGNEMPPVSRPAARHITRPRLLASTGLGVAGVSAVVALVLGTTTTSPAFAVTRNHDGTVTVRVLRSAGIAGANAKLHQLGIRAEVLPQAPLRCSGWVSIAGQGAPDPQRTLSHANWTIDPSNVPVGQTLALTPPRGSAASSGQNVRLCPPVPGQGQRTPASGTASTGTTTGTATTGTTTSTTSTASTTGTTTTGS